jgi:hypothetical protein
MPFRLGGGSILRQEIGKARVLRLVSHQPPCWGVAKEETIMTLTAENVHEHMSESHMYSDYFHDLIRELSKRLDALWRYDQYIANAEKHAFVQDFWSTLKQQDRENIRQLKELLANEFQRECP